VLGGAFLVLASIIEAACATGGAITPYTGGSATSSHHSSAHATASSSSAATSGSGGGTTANHDFTTAKPITVDGMAIAGALADLDTPDYYVFTGKKGDRLVMGALAEILASSTNTFDPSVIDTVVTVYDATKTAVASNNEPWPSDSTDAQLYLQLPADGSYFIQVEDCNLYAATRPGVVCNDAHRSSVASFDYQVFVLHTSDASYPEVNAGTGQDGTTARAVSFTYAMPIGGKPGQYGFYVIDGAFDSVSNTHVFMFTPPMDTAIAPGERARAEFFVEAPFADDGDGSTANVTAWVTDDAAGMHVLAEANQKYFTSGDDTTGGPLDLSLPITLGTTYYLFVQSEAPVASTTDYYFIQHTIGDYFIGQAELEGPTAEGMNDTPQTAETLAAPNAGFPGVFAVDGNISAPGMAMTPDLDWFKMVVPAMASEGTVACDVDRVGSGLGGFTATFYDLTGMTMLGPPIGPEMPDPTTRFTAPSPISVTAGQPVYLKLAAQTQETMDQGTHYRCFVQFQ
jgi:hypothetical protein